ncbi:MAG: methyltransferase domain-containing protein [Cyclobacteriaceae bacterium]|nr:methyltransferase domain-containing protein [Cyclobacteriaceae bacterium]
MGNRFSQRSQHIEIMDDLNCQGEVVEQTLRELEVINRLLGGNHVTINGIQKLLSDNIQNNKTLTIVDLGCGGGDILKEISRWANKHNINVRLVGIDANPFIVRFAENNCSDYRDIEFRVDNVFDANFQSQSFDIIVATLFTHHFSSQELSQLLSTLNRQAKIGVVINDLHRHWFAYHSIRILTRLFSRSKMVKFDAPLSVLRAFRKDDLVEVLNQAGIKHYILRWKWAFRWQLIIPKSLA